jgi:thiosulfate/3-mercaptopyruvate sulfurtransferase
MRTTLRFSLRVSALAAFLAVQTAPATAADARSDLVVTAAWLHEHINDANLVLLHLGDEKEYATAHLPGARHIDMADVSAPMDHSGAAPNALMLELPDKDALRQRLAAFGISDDSTIVAYYGSSWYSPTTRIIFTLTYAGLGNHAKLLDGGMPAWVAAGFATTTAAPPPARIGRLSPLATVDSVVDAAFVQSHAGTPGFAIVDARDKVFYDGVESGGDRDRPAYGHVPGALSVPFTEMMNDNGTLKSADELRAIFTNAGVKPNDEVIAYCHVGQQATAVLFAARTLGHKVRLYDGSMNDWIPRGLPLRKER